MIDSLKFEEAMKEAETVWKALETAIECFNGGADQEKLLRPRNLKSGRGPAASERAIAHRLAFYLELALRQDGLVTNAGKLAVDCEYNRHGSKAKTLAAEGEIKAIVKAARKRKKHILDEDGFLVFSVAHDIVVHQRGEDEDNRLIIEIKKATNRETPRYDASKLELFTTPRDDDYGYGYNFGAWVIAEDRLPSAKRKLRIAAKYHVGKIIK